MRSANNRILELDGLRGIAILMVLLHHLSVGGYLYHVAKNGWIGVDLFFVLSGYLITGILLNAKDKSHYYRNFVVRRMFRIFPLYYGLLIVVAIVLWGMPVLRQSNFSLWWYVAFLGNLRGAMLNTYGPGLALQVLWSLQVEEQFYLLYPLAVARLGVNQLRSLLVGCVLLAPLIRLFMLVFFKSNVGSILLMPCRMDSLAIGGLVAIGLQQAWLRIHWIKPLAWTGMSIALVGIVILRNESTSVIHSLLYTVLALGLGALLGTILLSRQSAPDGRILRVLRSRPLVYTGEISYGLYLLHVPVDNLMNFLMGRYLNFTPAHGSLLALAIALCASFLVASLSWRYFESPLLRVKERFTRDSMKAQPIFA